MLLTVPKTHCSLRNQWDALEVPLSSSVSRQKGPLIFRPEFRFIPLSGSGRKRNQVWKIRFRIHRNRKAVLNFRFRQCKTELRFWKSGIRFRFPKVLSGRTLLIVQSSFYSSWDNRSAKFCHFAKIHMHTCILHTYISVYLYFCIFAYIHTFIQTCKLAYFYTCILATLQIYIH